MTKEKLIFDTAKKEEIPTLSAIAIDNFISDINYSKLGDKAVRELIEANTEKSLINKSNNSNYAPFFVVRNRARKILGFSIIKMKESERLATQKRIHARREARGIGVGHRLLSGTEEWASNNGVDNFYVCASGESAPFFERSGHLYIDRIPNRKIDHTHVDLLMKDVNRARESRILPLIDTELPFYEEFLSNYGVAAEHLYEKIERMHDTNDSNISQNVLEHIKRGVLYVNDAKNDWAKDWQFLNWNDVYSTWIVHDMSEWGMDNDTPSHIKDQQDELYERNKGLRTIDSIQLDSLRKNMRNYFLSFEDRVRKEEGVIVGYDINGVFCRLIDKLEAADFFIESGILAIWRDQNGVKKQENISRKYALGGLIEPISLIAQNLNTNQKRVLYRRLEETITSYGKILSETFSDEMKSIFKKILQV